MPDGGNILVKSLKEHGVKYIFTLSGLQTRSIYNACRDEDIRLIDTRHELSAVFMADGWARATGRPGVALLSAGPGMTNGITGMVNAQAASSPILVIAGRSPLADAGRGAFQEVDQLRLAEPVTRWSATADRTDRIADYVDEAFDHCQRSRRGPVYIDIPVDILSSEAGSAGPETTDAAGDIDVTGAMPAIKQALSLVKNSSRPMILAGGGVRWAGAPEALNLFVGSTGIPVVTIDMARGVVPDDHPLCFGPVWTGLKYADLIIICGAKLDYRLKFGDGRTINSAAKLVRIDYPDADAEINRTVEVDIAGDIGTVLSQMAELAKDAHLPRYDDWVSECRSYTESHRNRLSGDISSVGVPIHPLRLCNEIRDFLNRDATIVVDGGDTTVFGQAGLAVYHPGHWLDVGPLWCIGVGVPFGIAAKLARPDDQVLILSGDGSFGYGVFEYNTAIRHDIPIVSVVSNDAAWGMIKHDQKSAYGEGGVTGTELGITRYDKIVEALGGYGEYVEQPDEIAPALKRAFASGLPACINVQVDPSVSSRYIFT